MVFNNMGNFYQSFRCVAVCLLLVFSGTSEVVVASEIHLLRSFPLSMCPSGGTSAYGGINGGGNVFKLSHTGEFSFDFHYPRDAYGMQRTGLIEGVDGFLYSATNAPFPIVEVEPPAEEPKLTLLSKSLAQPSLPVRSVATTKTFKKRNGAFRLSVGLERSDNRAPIVRGESIVIRRAGIWRVAVLRNDIERG